MIKTTLWDMLSVEKVIIPSIQRDYAQGRKGKDYIRRSFLTQIKSALDNRNELTLDFIYGNIECQSFRPLDGQQRLTTLWLLHWYFIFMSGQLNDDSKSVLKNFTYQTRNSSRDFCENLCDKMDYDMYSKCNNLKIASFIKSQNWFYSKWLQDPTINAMLRTLSGDDDSQNDNIEAVFGKEILDENVLYLKQNIKFYQLTIGSDELPLSDDLYIKMNARGKGLTHFENFKADLVSSFRNDEKFEKKKDNIFYYLYFASKLDNEWTQIFWESANENFKEAGFKEKNEFDGKIDDISFAFFNRYIANLICVKEAQPDKIAAFNHICGTGLGKKKRADDSKVKYEGFDKYNDYFSFDCLNNLDKIFMSYYDNKGTINDILSEIDSENQEEDAEKMSNIITFIPQYKYEEKYKFLLPITLNERIYFYAVCLFLETIEDFDKKKFERWMRVTKNIIENAAISSVPVMVTCLKEIDRIGRAAKEVDWNVYESLISYNPENVDSYLGRQIIEEKEKALQIYQNDSISEEWEIKIKEAEKYSFFKGTIRFLYKDDENKINWNNFEQKFKNAKKLFDQVDNTVSCKTIKKLLGLFDKFGEISNLFLFTTIGYHPRNKNWKTNILCNYENEILVSKVHKLLMGEEHLNSKDNDYSAFLDSGIIEFITKKEKNHKYRCRETEKSFAIQMENGQEGVFVGEKFVKRFKELTDLSNCSKIELGDNNKYIKPYYWGKCITIKYNNTQYNWYGSENIYKIDSNDNEVLLEGKNLSDNKTILDIIAESA